MNSERRVVVTGIGVISPIGHSLDEMKSSLLKLRSGVQRMNDWDLIDHLRIRVAAPCQEIDKNRIPRINRRTMDRVSILAALAAQDAISDSGLDLEHLDMSSFGVAFGSTSGGAESMSTFFKEAFVNRSFRGIPSSSYLKFMNHTCAANLAAMYHCQGPLIASSTACVSGSQGVGFGYEAIRYGKADIMLAGGSEELHYWGAGVFDILHAASSHYNDRPEDTPRPFDIARDGLATGEGSGCLILEEYEHARRRGASIHAELLSYATNCDGAHLTHPDSRGMAKVMQLALRHAGLSPDDIQHVNAHATATSQGDLAEAQAIYNVFGDKVPVSALKGYLGHSLGACGAIESIASILMMKEGFMAATKNLDEPDPALAPIDHVLREARDAKMTLAMNNNFAFGGINTSLIFRQV